MLLDRAWSRFRLTGGRMSYWVVGFILAIDTDGVVILPSGMLVVHLVPRIRDPLLGFSQGLTVLAGVFNQSTEPLWWLTQLYLIRQTLSCYSMWPLLDTS